MNIAIIGYGTVGGGVHELLKDGRLGIHVKRVLDIRPLEGLEGMLTDNIAEILSDRSIDCIVETIGGMYPAMSYVTAALRAGKHVATSNKELVSHALAPLAEGAAMHNVQIRFSASVGGGIPWIDNLVRQKRGDILLSINGIANGTTNYILYAMQRGAEFEAALAEAQALGYAEFDPSADLEGTDVQRKCAISASLAFDTIIEPEAVPTLGIATIRKADMEAFAAHNVVCKLMMTASRLDDGAVSAYVEPQLLPLSEMAAHTPTNHNFLSVTGRHVGRLSFAGQGAGRYPTAANIIQDLLDISTRIVYRSRIVQPEEVHNEGVLHRYYVRAEGNPALPGPVDVWGDGVLTAPMSVKAMHEMAKTLRASDPNAFVAGLAEG